jgi:hypothetical protein
MVLCINVITHILVNYLNCDLLGDSKERLLDSGKINTYIERIVKRGGLGGGVESLNLEKPCFLVMRRMVSTSSHPPQSLSILLGY